MQLTIVKNSLYLALATGLSANLASGQVVGNARDNSRKGGRVEAEISPSFVPTSLRQLVDRSALIVDGTVVSVLPSTTYPTNSRFPEIETRAKVRVDRVLKGVVTAPSNEILVAQVGGKVDDWEVTTASDSLVQPGERFIFFLTPESPAWAKDAIVAHVFRLTGALGGRVAIHNKKASIPSYLAKPLESYQGMDESSFLKQVADLVAGTDQTPPRTGRTPFPGGPGLVVEKGTVNPEARKKP